VVEEQITPGLMIITTMVVARALMPINQIVGSWRSFVAARGAARRLTQLLEDFQAPRTDRVTLPALQGAVFAERLVVARQGGGPPILKGVSFDVPANTLVGIIGPSGGGKTTLVRAILGVVPLAQGIVRIDRADIETLNRAEIGSAIGYLPQDIELFNGTVAENIARFGVLDSPQIVEAAKLAGVHEMILGLSDGYETVIGEQGGVLSAGQRQRIALARAVYGQPKLVVLDEPNSNLDAEGEQALFAALRTLKERGATVLVIAHRSSMLAGLDRLLVIREGVVAEYGPVSEMLPKMMRPVSVQPQQAQRA
jgi:ATP-binding cassette subfamily C protein EexD